jgi:hypothetical protein
MGTPHPLLLCSSDNFLPSENKQSVGLNHELEGIKKIFSQQGLKGGRMSTKFICWKAGMPTCRHDAHCVVFFFCQTLGTLACM